MNDLSAKIAALSFEKREMLKQIIKNKQREQHASENSGVMGVKQLLQEAVLPPDIYPQGSPRPGISAQAQAILLTGSTGFIGAFLLDELLRTTSADIYCLVRADNPEAGLQRISENLEAYELWQPAYASRIISIVGDLTQPNLGVTAPVYEHLVNAIESIYHCGAMVKWTYPYSALKSANVVGTQEMLRLACCKVIKPFHFISTVGVFSSPHFLADCIEESTALEESGPLYGGYAQSKWVSEKLVTIAGSRGLPVSIYRPNTEGHSQTGVFNPQDHLCLITKGCIHLGIAPDTLNMMVAGAPIDYAAQAMVQISQQPSSLGKTFHIVNPTPITWKAWITQISSLGYPVKILPYELWKTEAITQIRQSKDSELYALTPIFSDGLLESAKLPIFDCSNVSQALMNSPIECPNLDAALLKVYLSCFVKRGFLSAPSPVLCH